MQLHKSKLCNSNITGAAATAASPEQQHHSIP
jgi:hypothetical protein